MTTAYNLPSFSQPISSHNFEVYFLAIHINIIFSYSLFISMQVLSNAALGKLKCTPDSRCTASCSAKILPSINKVLITVWTQLNSIFV